MWGYWEKSENIKCYSLQLKKLIKGRIHDHDSWIPGERENIKYLKLKHE
jgi:hypothetical protein